MTQWVNHKFQLVNKYQAATFPESSPVRHNVNKAKERGFVNQYLNTTLRLQD